MAGKELLNRMRERTHNIQIEKKFQSAFFFKRFGSFHCSVEQKRFFSIISSWTTIDSTHQNEKKGNDEWCVRPGVSLSLPFSLVGPPLKESEETSSIPSSSDIHYFFPFFFSKSLFRMKNISEIDCKDWNKSKDSMSKMEAATRGNGTWTRRRLYLLEMYLDLCIEPRDQSKSL
jgi:hypothetical protein